MYHYRGSGLERPNLDFMLSEAVATKPAGAGLLAARHRQQKPVSLTASLSTKRRKLGWLEAVNVIFRFTAQGEHHQNPCRSKYLNNVLEAGSSG